jgi:hypothetical protein
MSKTIQVYNIIRDFIFTVARQETDHLLLFVNRASDLRSPWRETEHEVEMLENVEPVLHRVVCHLQVSGQGWNRQGGSHL